METTTKRAISSSPIHAFIYCIELLVAFLRSGATNHFAINNPRPETKAYVDAIFSLPQIIVDVSLRPGAGFARTGDPIYGDSRVHTHHVAVTPAGGTYAVHSLNTGAADSVASLLFQCWQTDMFFFTAERFAVGKSVFGNADRLQSNAANLPAVLDTLSGSRGSLFAKLVDHLREIFPTVGNLSVRPMPDGTNVNEIRVWPVETMSRAELSFPLDQSGTGVAQVIALLTAIMTIEQAVIIIDEINSFLHPKGVRALFKQIQYQANSINTKGVFIASFAASGDDLHMWNLYADRGEGLSFTIPLHKVQDWGCFPACCRYDTHSIDQFCVGALETVAKCLIEEKRGGLSPDLESYAATFLWNISYFAAVFKPHSWADEQEWRLIFMNPLAEVKQREDGNSFIEVPKTERLPIEAVCAGPNCSVETVDEFHALNLEMNLNVPLFYSKSRKVAPAE